MDWIRRWQDNQIGWHRDNFNSRMIKFLSKLNLKDGDSIFVPLCGKTLDMIYLVDQGFKVIAVELSEIATKDFFSENNINYDIEIIDNFTVYKSENITIYQGDIFNLEQQHLQNISAIYDRASLVALNPQLRCEYAKLFNGIIKNGVNYLLLTLNYNQDLIDGPPFAVGFNEVQELFKNWDIAQIDSFNDIENESKFRTNGLTKLYKDSYILRKN